MPCLLKLDAAGLGERFRLGHRDRTGPRTSACRVYCKRVGAGSRRSRTIGAFEKPRDYKLMHAAADIRRNEVEAVRRERALNQIRAAVTEKSAKG